MVRTGLTGCAVARPYVTRTTPRGPATPPVYDKSSSLFRLRFQPDSSSLSTTFSVMSFPPVLWLTLTDVDRVHDPTTCHKALPSRETGFDGIRQFAVEELLRQGPVRGIAIRPRPYG